MEGLGDLPRPAVRISDLGCFSDGVGTPGPCGTSSPASARDNKDLAALAQSLARTPRTLQLSMAPARERNGAILQVFTTMSRQLCQRRCHCACIWCSHARRLYLWRFAPSGSPAVALSHGLRCDLFATEQRGFDRPAAEYMGHGQSAPPSLPSLRRRSTSAAPAQHRRSTPRNKPTASAGGDITLSPTVISPPVHAAVRAPVGAGAAPPSNKPMASAGGDITALPAVILPPMHAAVRAPAGAGAVPARPPAQQTNGERRR